MNMIDIYFTIIVDVCIDTISNITGCTFKSQYSKIKIKMWPIFFKSYETRIKSYKKILHRLKFPFYIGVFLL